MKLGMGIVLVLVCGFSFAADNDTLPLKSRTSPRVGGEPLETTLLDAKKGPSSVATKKAVGHPTDRPYVASIDVFGTTRLNEIIVREFLGHDLDVWFDKGLKGDPASLDIEKRLAEKLKKHFDLAMVEWSIVQLFEPNNLAIHVTLDVVEKADVAKRLSFLPDPIKEFEDPGHLVQNWMEYEETAIDLVESGKLNPMSETCPAFHCPFGHKHPKLKKYEKIFVAGVAKYSKELEQILKEDSRPDYRASAAYLLPYLKDGSKVVALMVDRIKDPNDLVRNNALRVLGDIAQFHTDLLIPVRPVLQALNYPRVSDRTKAVFVLYLMCMNSQSTRDEIMKSSVPDLLALLDSRQPDERDVAHVILRKLSSKDYAVTDIADWRRWYERTVASNAQITRK
jgi:hypothetical protein